WWFCPSVLSSTKHCISLEYFFFSSRRRHTRFSRDWSSDVCSSDLIYLYPSTCLFEGTVMSLGRGTSFPFEVYGHPDYKGSDFSFTPRSLPGAKNPPLLNKKCFGVDLRNVPNDEIIGKEFDLTYIIDAYNNLNIGEKFFTSFFENLVGVNYIRRDIMNGKSAEEIKDKWADDV